MEFKLSNFSELIAIFERIAKGEGVQTDTSTVISILTNLGVAADDIQKFTSILNTDRQQVYQIVLQLGKNNYNMGKAQSNQFGEIYNGINPELIKEVLREVLQEVFSNTSINTLAKNLPAVDYEITEKLECTNSEIFQYLPKSELPAISTFNFETVTVGKQGNITKRSIKQAEYFVEDLNKGVELKMVSIPGGSFTMGASKDESGTVEDERPQHLVTLKPFFLGKYPITQAQWREVANFPKIKYKLESEPSYFRGDKLPVECISWYEAQEFCARLSQKTGRVYRPEKSNHSNQGIRNSFINASVIGIASGLMIGVISGYTKGISFGLIFWLISGGAACIQHFILRLVLYCNGYIPWNYSKFLNYATERTILQRVGGSYRFIHSLLQEHFVNMSFNTNNQQ